jgi:hypothetical protein
MTKNELERKTAATVEETKTALQTVYDALNQGQQKKLLKDEAVAALFERYGVEV